MDNKTQERIKADAREVYPVSWQYQERIGYIAGATAENEKTEATINAAIHKERNALQAKVTQIDMDWLKRSQVLVDALETIANSPTPANEHEIQSWIETARTLATSAWEQWKSGKGKEVGNG